MLNAKLQSFIVIIYCCLSNIFTPCHYTVFRAFATIRQLMINQNTNVSNIDLLDKPIANSIQSYTNFVCYLSREFVRITGCFVDRNCLKVKKGWSAGLNKLGGSWYKRFVYRCFWDSDVSISGFWARVI